MDHGKMYELQRFMERFENLCNDMKVLPVISQNDAAMSLEALPAGQRVLVDYSPPMHSLFITGVSDKSTLQKVFVVVENNYNSSTVASVVSNRDAADGKVCDLLPKKQESDGFSIDVEKWEVDGDCVEKEEEL